MVFSGVVTAGVLFVFDDYATQDGALRYRLKKKLIKNSELGW